MSDRSGATPPRRVSRRSAIRAGATRSSLRCGAALVLLVLALAPSFARAQADEARDLFERGVVAADAADDARAIELFERSVALVPRASTFFNLGVALRRARRIDAAIDAFERFVEHAGDDVDAARRDEAARLLAELRAIGAVLEVRVPPRAHVEVDGEDMGRGPTLVLDVAAGDHEVTARLPDRAPRTERVSVARGERRRLEIALDAPAGTPSHDALGALDVATIIGGALAGVSLAIGIGASVTHDGQVADFNGERCAPLVSGTRAERCPSLRAAIDVSYDVAAGAWTAFGVLAAATIVLAVVPRPAGDDASLACAEIADERTGGVACRAGF